MTIERKGLASQDFQLQRSFIGIDFFKTNATEKALIDLMISWKKFMIKKTNQVPEPGSKLEKALKKRRTHFFRFSIESEEEEAPKHHKLPKGIGPKQYKK